MSRVLVICHNPTVDGNIVWPDHEIVGYVDIFPAGKRIKPNAPYYQGWDSVPADLVGTIDIVLSLFCPVSDAFHGRVKTFDVVETRMGETVIRTTTINDIFRRGFSYLKPGGYMLFPNIDEERVPSIKSLPIFQSEFGAENIQFVGMIPAITKVGVRDPTDFTATPFMKITKRVAGGRRRKTRRARRSKKTRRVKP
jgi:hypothetical protein